MGDLAILLGATVVMLIGLALVVAGFQRRTAKVDLLTLLDDDTFIDDDNLDEYSQRLEDPVFSRLFGPMGRMLSSRLSGLLPSNHLATASRRLVLAGISGQTSAEEYLAYQVVGLAGGSLLGAFLAFALGWSISGTIGMTIGIGVFGFSAPSIYVRQTRDVRVMSIETDLPDVLDVLAISVEAGVGFEQAIQAVTERFDSPLSSELAHVLSEMELGLARREALQNLRSRTEVNDLNGFILAMIQADALGMPMREVLKGQAAEMRRRRRQKVREAAAQLPVKLLFPLVILILPSLFIVILGPAALRILRAF